MNTFKALLKNLLIAGLLASSLSACVPLIAGGVGTGVASTIDRRTYAEQYKDQELEVKIMRAINRKLDDKANVSTTVFNKRVLLTGQALSESYKAEAAKLARETEGVASVFDEVTVGWPATFGTGASDRLITSSVKTRLFDPELKSVSGHHVKVVTESGIVYLMGLLGQSEADAAVKIASTTRNVTKVVSVIEVISDEEIKRLDKKLEPSNSPTSQR
ncbi:BON domain-containing protein [Viridibacterium curvum]|uniref:BON domain-containing protein n=1 Tax=Viridibacterium curvum TaxID=1101404 RepID=A0ABP9R2R4_9RHOO